MGARIIDIVALLVIGAIVGFFLPIIGPLLVGAAYEIVFVALRGQTLGKMATKIQIVRADSGDLPDWIASIGRWAIPFVGWILLLLPGLLVNASLLWDDRRQGWHDKAVKTLVVKV